MPCVIRWTPRGLRAAIAPDVWERRPLSTAADIMSVWHCQVVLDPVLTLGDVCRALTGVADAERLDPLLGCDVRAFLDEAAAPPAPVDTTIVALEVAAVIELDVGGLEPVRRLSFAAVAVDGGDAIGVSFAPMPALTSYPLRATAEGGAFTVGEFLFAIFDEIGRYGDPEDRATIRADLRADDAAA